MAKQSEYIGIHPSSSQFDLKPYHKQRNQQHIDFEETIPSDSIAVVNLKFLGIELKVDLLNTYPILV